MNIGIDIDNTITEIQNELNKAAYDYAIKLGKNIDNNLQDIDKNGDTYEEKFQFSYDELKYFLKNIQEDIANKAKPRDNAVDVINKLKKEGHKIVIITARDSEFHDNPYFFSKNWLDENNIKYDKIIVNARKKGIVCKNENIDLFIDDQLKNCIEDEKEGIQTIRISDDNKKYTNVIPLKDWKEIYRFILSTRICKIVKFDECEHKFDINNFISECMHKFIGRPYKNRIDVMNIDDYYLKNNGQFLIAYDVRDKKIVGTIALENRQKYGIIKRFYVIADYQGKGIGKMLYNLLEIYIREETNINKIYLSCGNILKKAHNFYLKNGFEQINKLDIEMHFADDDDFFVKNIER
mgnify:CR=1 FL=1